MNVNAYNAYAETAAVMKKGGSDTHTLELQDSENIHARHVSSVSTLAIPIPVLTNFQHRYLDSLLRSLLWEGHLPGFKRKVEIFRTKGMFTNGDDGRTYVIQGVREIYEIKALQSRGASETMAESQGKLVFIGKDLDKELGDSLNKAISLIQ